MKVRATKAGFYQRLWEVGRAFEVPPHLFSSRWMEKVEEPEAEEPSPGEANNALRHAETHGQWKQADGSQSRKSGKPKKRGRPKKTPDRDG